MCAADPVLSAQHSTAQHSQQGIALGALLLLLRLWRFPAALPLNQLHQCFYCLMSSQQSGMLCYCSAAAVLPAAAAALLVTHSTCQIASSGPPMTQHHYTTGGPLEMPYRP
jgi:hypothetical protein